METGNWRHVVLAPAFPAQGRITRNGQVLVRHGDGAFNAVAPNLAALLEAESLQAHARSAEYRIVADKEGN